MLETEGREHADNARRLSPVPRRTAAPIFAASRLGYYQWSTDKCEFDIGPHRWMQIEAEW